MGKINTENSIFTQKTTQAANNELPEMTNFQLMLKNGEISTEDYNRLTAPSLYSTKEPLNQVDEYFEPSYLTYKEENLAKKFFRILSNDTYINEKALLENLNKIQKRDLTAILEYYRRFSKGIGLLNTIQGNENISTETKNKFKDVFTQTLEKDYNFNPQYTNKNSKVSFEKNGYKYESDTYNINQIDTNTLEVINTTTNEKKVIGLKKLIPENMNGISDIISLKATLQKLPGEILFQIPEEISFILSKNVVDVGSIIKDENSYQYNGVVAMLGENKDVQLFISTENPDTLVHELAHAIFYDKNGKNELLTNEKFIELYNNGCKSVEKAGINPNQPLYNWTQKPDELSADVLKAVMLNNKEQIDIIEKNAPGVTEIVIEHYKKIKEKPNDEKHIHYTGEEFFKNIDNLI